MDCVTPSNPLGLDKGYEVPPGQLEPPLVKAVLWKRIEFGMMNQMLLLLVVVVLFVVLAVSVLMLVLVVSGIASGGTDLWYWC